MATEKFLNLEGLGRVADKVNQKLRVVTTVPEDPEDQDIILYKGISSLSFTNGCIYVYNANNYYAWSMAAGSSSVNCYTKSETPSEGDLVYDLDKGVVGEAGSVIKSYDESLDQITFLLSPEVPVEMTASRNTTKDVNSGWVLQDTSIILNGTNKTGKETNFYAPLEAGSAGQVLMSNGSNQAPSWGAAGGYCPTFIDDSLCFYSGLIPEVEGTAIIFDLDE